VSRKHLDAYLDEFVFRFNRRTSRKRGLLFYRLLELAVRARPTTYETIVWSRRWAAWHRRCVDGVLGCGECDGTR
jgi:hypothetical protein